MAKDCDVVVPYGSMDLQKAVSERTFFEGILSVESVTKLLLDYGIRQAIEDAMVRRMLAISVALVYGTNLRANGIG